MMFVLLYPILGLILLGFVGETVFRPICGALCGKPQLGTTISLGIAVTAAALLSDGNLCAVLVAALIWTWGWGLGGRVRPIH